MTTALAIVLPSLFCAAILAREPEATWELPPAARALDPELGSVGQVLLSGPGAWGGLPLDARFAPSPGEGAVVELTPVQPLRRPDLLVYWTSDKATDELAPDALLLGKLGESRRSFALSREGGYLTLFDLAQGELIASQPVPVRLGD